MLHNKRKIILALVIICLIGLVGLGISYAYWKFTYTQTDNNVAVSKCLKLEISNESNAINLDNMYPISDEEGRKLTPYSFKITNTCSMSAEYKVNLEMLEGTTLNSKFVASLVNNGDIKLLSIYNTTKTTISGSVESRILDTSVLTPGASKEYSISLWMDKSVTLADDAENKSFKAKVVIDAAMSKKTVQDMIISQLDTTGKCPTVNADGTVNVTGAESENSLLCSAPDNYGTSYYYRGNVTNNYVKFVGFYWRIVRINGDGSIRIVYDGTSAHENGKANKDRIIGTSNFNEQYYDNAYVGYMYGKTGSSTYAETHDNINDSTIKKYIDNWYETNIKNTNYEQYLDDNYFCNDRSFAQNNIGTGYSTSQTNFRSRNDSNATLVCKNMNDMLTVKKQTFGNGSLNYSISMLSYDEVVLAGANDYTNKDYYLFTGIYYWLLSPYKYSEYSLVLTVSDYGQTVGHFVANKFGVKPVINLMKNSLIFGTGTINNPYMVTSE